MDNMLNIDGLKFFILLVFPGLVSMRVYRLLMPARPVDWSNAVVEGLFYSIVNFALFLPLIIPIHLNNFPVRHPVLYALCGIIVLLLGPIAWPVVFTKIARSKVFASKLQIPFPSSWDYFFDKREPVFVLIHLKNGKMVGGYYGSESYATSFPNEGDIYLETVFKMDDYGIFGNAIPDSRGLLIRKEEYSYVELFGVPE